MRPVGGRSGCVGTSARSSFATRRSKISSKVKRHSQASRTIAPAISAAWATQAGVKLPPSQRQAECQRQIKPLIDDFFAWVHRASRTQEGRTLAAKAMALLDGRPNASIDDVDRACATDADCLGRRAILRCRSQNSADELFKHPPDITCRRTDSIVDVDFTVDRHDAG
mgnify:CR=1 FL=1